MLFGCLSQKDAVVCEKNLGSLYRTVEHSATPIRKLAAQIATSQRLARLIRLPALTVNESSKCYRFPALNCCYRLNVWIAPLFCGGPDATDKLGPRGK